MSREHAVVASDPLPGLVPLWALYATVFTTGAAVMVVEIMGTRIIAPVFGVSLFVWSALLAITLWSLAIGYYVGGILVDKAPNARLLGYVVLGGGVFLGLAGPTRRPILFLAETLGPRAGPLVAAAFMFGPCLLTLGMAGPVAVRLATIDLMTAGRRSGTIYAISTAGSLLGTLATAFILVPEFETSQIRNRSHPGE